MARYDYRCHECTAVFEVQRRMTNANTPAACPTCGSENTYKLLSHISIVGTAQQQPFSSANQGGGCGCGGSCACGAH